LFASYRPNTEFAISFDLDVIKLYEDYDRAVRLAHEAEDGGKKDRKRQTARRVLELSSVVRRTIEPGSAAPTLIAFRHLSTVLQTFDGDISGAADYFVASGELPEADRPRFESRAQCVWNWVEAYAPEDFRYRIRTEPVVREIPAEQQEPLQRLVELLKADASPTETSLGGKMSEMSKSGVDMKAFFPVVYDLLLGRDRGPKMSTLLAIMTPARALPLLEPSAG